MQPRLDATRGFVQVFAIEHDNGAASPFPHDLIREVQQEEAAGRRPRRAASASPTVLEEDSTLAGDGSSGADRGTAGRAARLGRPERGASSLTARAYSAELGADGWRFHDPQIGQWSHRSAVSAASTGRSTSHVW